MRRFLSYDGTELAYRVVGDGPPLVCVPGGPGQAVSYLGDLGGLDAHRTLILLDNRGTGDSAVPADPATYRVDRLVADVEALRAELGLERMDLFVHSASGGIGMLYAAAHPDRLHHLVLADPSLRAIGLDSAVRADAVIAARSGEPWYAEAHTAYQASLRAETYQEASRHWMASAPLSYGRWTDAARRHAEAAPGEFARPATEGFYAGYHMDPGVPARLAKLAAPVLVIAGEHDLWPTHAATEQLRTLFATCDVVGLPGAGHFPWVDDPEAFSGLVARFLSAVTPG